MNHNTLFYVALILINKIAFHINSHKCNNVYIHVPISWVNILPKPFSYDHLTQSHIWHVSHIFFHLFYLHVKHNTSYTIQFNTIASP